MKKTIKGFAMGLIVGIGILALGTNAYINTDAGTLGNLFEKVGSVYKLLGDNIKDNTIDGSELESSVDVSECGNEEVLGGDGICHNKSWGDTKLTESEVDNFVSNNGYITNLGDIKYLKNGSKNTTLKNKMYDVLVDDTLWVKKNLYIDGDLIIKGKKYKEMTTSFSDMVKNRYSDRNNFTAAKQFTSDLFSHYNCNPNRYDGTMQCSCSVMTNLNTKSAKGITGIWGRSPWYWGNKKYFSLYNLKWDIAKYHFEKNGKVVKDVQLIDVKGRDDIRDDCGGDTIPFTIFDLRVEFKDKTILVSYN